MRTATLRGLLLVALVSCTAAPDHPLPRPVGGRSLLTAGTPLRLTAVASGLDRPTDIQSTAAEPGTLYVAEQAGRIRAVDLATGSVRAAPLVDLGAEVSQDYSRGQQEGLLAFAFHPRYPADDRIFAHVVDLRAHDVLYELHVADGRRRVLLDLPGAEPWHNGGQLLFGPDRYLYVAIGDGCAGGCDCHGNAGNVAVLRGKVLRLDVDRGEPYGIPGDNPFAAGGGAPEVWLWGLRNPWRMSFDEAGHLYIADVGDQAWEEVSVYDASHGGPRHLGWPVFEGIACVSAGEGSPCAGGECADPAARFTPPVLAYHHQARRALDPATEVDTLGGCSIIGGRVYRGARIPELRGTYFYSDHCAGWVRSIDYATREQRDYDFWVGRDLHPTTFGEDAAGEMYVADVSGVIHRIDPAGERVPAPRYERLSDTGLYADLATGALGDRVWGYTPAHALWSDGADKRRFVWLPPGTQIDSGDMDHWLLPIGTRLWKEFSIDGRPIETRLIERYGPGPDDYFMGAFVWNEDGTDAVLAEDGARDAGGTAHDVPGMRDCWRCHGGEPGRVLGFSAVQLSRPGDGLSLRWLIEAGKLSVPPPEGAGADFSPPGEAPTAAALGYLHANCGHCHNPRGGGSVIDMVLRLSVDDARHGDPAATATVRTTLGRELALWHAPGVEHRVSGGDPEASAILARMSIRGTGQMPPLATEEVDEAGLALVRAFIEALPSGATPASGLARLRGMLQSDSGRAAGLQVTAWGHRDGILRSARTDAAGRFTFGELLPADQQYNLVVNAVFVGDDAAACGCPDCFQPPWCVLDMEGGGFDSARNIRNDVALAPGPDGAHVERITVP